MVLMLLGPLCGWWGAPAPVGAHHKHHHVRSLPVLKAMCAGAVRDRCHRQRLCYV
jgi:hypothetical protein